MLSSLQGQSLSPVLPRPHPSPIYPTVFPPTNPSTHGRIKLAVRGAPPHDSPHLQSKRLGSCLALVLPSLTKPALSYLKLLNPNSSPQNLSPKQEDLQVLDLGQENPQDLHLHNKGHEPLFSSSSPPQTPLNPKLVVLSVRQTSTLATQKNNPTTTPAHSVTPKCATCVDSIPLHT